MAEGRNRNRTGRADRRLASLIANQMATVIPNIVVQVQQALNPGEGNPVNPAGGNPPPPCSYKYFNSCKPPKYEGTEGATALLRWFEEMENTFLNSECPDNRRVRYSTACLLSHALTWWNGEKQSRGTEAAMAMTWDQLKELMTQQFCPQNEIRKLETEFWELKQESGENSAYNHRFHELRQLVPYLATPLSRAIERYIGGLPKQIRDSVRSSNPATLEAAIRLAAQLTDDHVKDGTLTRKGSKTTADKTTAEKPKETEPESSTQSNNKKKRKGNHGNYAVTTSNPAIPAIPLNQVAPNKKPYTGVQPLCNQCQLHHPPTAPCRYCSVCNVYGHANDRCRRSQRQPGTQYQPQPNAPIMAQPFYPPNNQAMVPVPAHPFVQNMAQPYFQPNVPFVRACFNCGDPGHFRNTCPRLVNIINTQAQANPVNQVNQNQNPPNQNQAARGRAFNINANQAQANNDVVNGTFLINSHYAFVLFYSRADKGFVSFKFKPILEIPRVSLGYSSTVHISVFLSQMVKFFVYLVKNPPRG
jgi:hypothetical protein